MITTMTETMTIDPFDFYEEKKDDNVEDLEYQLSLSRAVDRVKIMVDHFGADSVTVLTSFGVQSGIMLALVAEACPEVRVLYINTQGPTSEGDLEYGRQLLDFLGLKNFTIAKAGVTRDEFREGMEVLGISHDQMKDGQNVFHKLSQDVFKVQPLKQECANSSVKCLLSGVRRGQTRDRDHFKFLQHSQDDSPSRGHPILDWSDEQCLEFLRLKNIPPHPQLTSVLEDMVSAAKNQDSSKPKLKRVTSSLRSRRVSRGSEKECGIHVQDNNKSSNNNKDPVPPLQNMVVGKIKCKFCVAAKKLLAEWNIEFVEAPVHLFPHLIPEGTKTVPVVYLNKKLIGGYGNLCEYFEVEDTINSK